MQGPRPTTVSIGSMATMRAPLVTPAAPGVPISPTKATATAMASAHSQITSLASQAVRSPVVAQPVRQNVTVAPSTRDHASVTVAPSFQQGDQVEAQWGQESWFPATIAKNNGDGTFTVDWQDGNTHGRKKRADELRRRGAACHMTGSSINISCAKIPATLGPDPGMDHQDNPTNVAFISTIKSPKTNTPRITHMDTSSSISTAAPSPHSVSSKMAPSPQSISPTMAASPHNVFSTMAPSPQSISSTMAPSPHNVFSTIAPSPQNVSSGPSPQSELTGASNLQNDYCTTPKSHPIPQTPIVKEVITPPSPQDNEKLITGVRNIQEDLVTEPKPRDDVRCFVVELANGENGVVVENKEGKRWRFMKNSIEFELAADAEALATWLDGIKDQQFPGLLTLLGAEVTERGEKLKEIEKERDALRGTEDYEFFGLDGSECTDKDIERAYRQKSMRLHPDKGGDEEAFDQMRKKYEQIVSLRGESKRKEGGGSIKWDPNSRKSMMQAHSDLREQVIWISRNIEEVQKEVDERLRRQKIRHTLTWASEADSFGTRCAHDAERMVPLNTQPLRSH